MLANRRTWRRTDRASSTVVRDQPLAKTQLIVERSFIAEAVARGGTEDIRELAAPRAGERWRVTVDLASLAVRPFSVGTRLPGLRGRRVVDDVVLSLFAYP